MRLAARSVSRTTASGSLLGTIVVRNATRSAASGVTGIGSRAVIDASDSDTTLTSRSSSTQAIEQITKMLATRAAWATGPGFVSAKWSGWSSQTQKKISKQTLSSAISSEPTWRRLPSIVRMVRYLTR